MIGRERKNQVNIKHILFGLACIGIVGCTDTSDTVVAKTTAKHIQFEGNSGRYVIMEVCIDGVVYLLFDKGISPKFNDRRLVVLCGDASQR